MESGQCCVVFAISDHRMAMLHKGGYSSFFSFTECVRIWVNLIKEDICSVTCNSVTLKEYHRTCSKMFGTIVIAISSIL